MRDLSVVLKSDYVPDGIVKKARVTLYRDDGRREMYGALVDLPGRDYHRGEQITYFTELPPGPYILQVELVNEALAMVNMQRLQFVMDHTPWALQFEFPRPQLDRPAPVVAPRRLPH